MRARDLFGPSSVEFQCPVLWTTASEVGEEVAFRAPHDLKVTAVRWIPVSAVVGHGTNFVGMGVTNKELDGQGAVVVAFHDFDDAGTVDDIAVFDEHDIALSATAANLEVLEGEILTVEKTAGGTGEAGDGIVIIEYVSN